MGILLINDRSWYIWTEEALGNWEKQCKRLIGSPIIWGDSAPYHREKQLPKHDQAVPRS
jgi:hypothetical protein